MQADNRVVFIDVETTKKPKFKPWQKDAALCVVGVHDDTSYSNWVLYHASYTGELTQTEIRDSINEALSNTKLIVGHNLKFDLLWLKSIGVRFEHCCLYDTQIAEYLITGQSGVRENGYYTLEATSLRYGGEPKHDIVKTEYWDKGIDTPDIPIDILCSYLENDVCITRNLYYQQKKVLPKELVPHVELACEEMRALVDIEFEGMCVDTRILDEQLSAYTQDIRTIDTMCTSIVGRQLNFDSGVQLSCALFGGTYPVGAREWFYSQRGNTNKLRSKRVTLNTYYPGLGFKPLPNTEVKNKSGIYKTNRDVLRQLKCVTAGQRKFKKLLLQRSKTQKQIELIGTAGGKGLLHMIEDGRIHTEYNQTVTATTRLSSKNPNLQNLPRDSTAKVKMAFVSKYDR